MNEHLLKKNKQRFKELNITKWQEAGYTGAGIKIAIFGVGEDAHHNGEWLIQSVSKDIEVIELDCMHGSWKEALQYCIDNDIDIICSSLVKSSWSDEIEELSKQLYENGCIMIDSADNHGTEICRWPALSKYWFVVGSTDGYHRMGFSNWGMKLDFMMYTNFASKNKKGNYISISHTSGSTQVPSGIVSILKQFYGRKNFGGDEFKAYLEKYCKDLEESGKDLDTGYGLLKLPDKILEKEVINVGSPIRDLNKLHPYVKTLAEKLIEKCSEAGISIIVTETLRTMKRQAELYEQGRTKPGSIVTNATPGNSIHNYGLAFDIVPVINGKAVWNRHDLFDKVGAIGESIGLTWGGHFKTITDKPHFQWTGGVALSELKAGKRPDIPEEKEGKQQVSTWAKESWKKAIKKGINDGEGPQNSVTEEQLMVFFDRLGLLD